MLRISELKKVIEEFWALISRPKDQKRLKVSFSCSLDLKSDSLLDFYHNNIHEKISSFRLVESSTIFSKYSAKKRNSVPKKESQCKFL